MNKRKALGLAILFASASVQSLCQHAFGDTDSSAALLPLSYLEQARTVSGLARQSLGSKLFPTSTEALRPAPYFQRDYREDWIGAPLGERIKLAERIGNQGRARFAAERGWTTIVGSRARGIVQGPDSVVWDAQGGNVRVLEAKGGSSVVKRTYRSWQGTNRNAIRSAEFVLGSSSASPLERVAAARVIRAAQANRLQTGVVRTSHLRGGPGGPRLEGEWSRENVAKEALAIEQRITRQNRAAASAFRAAGAAQSSDVLRFRAAQGVAVLGLAGSGLLGWDAFQQSRVAWEMWNDQANGGSARPFLQIALAGGRWAEAGTAGLGTAADLGLLARGGMNAFGRAAGRVFLPISVGVEGLSAGIAYYDYRTGRIGQRELYRRTTGPAIFAVFTTGGAIVGGLAGAGVSVPTFCLAAPETIPAGVALGAGIGALVAVPFQVMADWTWNWYYSEFDETLRAAVNRAVDRHYLSER